MVITNKLEIGAFDLPTSGPHIEYTEQKQAIGNIKAILVEKRADAINKRLEIFPADAVAFTASSATMWLLGFCGPAVIPNLPYFGLWIHSLVVFAIILIMLKLFDDNCNYAGVHFIQDSKNRTRMAQIQRLFRNETRN